MSNSGVITASHTSSKCIKHVGNIYYLNKYEVTHFEDFAVLDLVKVFEVASVVSADVRDDGGRDQLLKESH